MNFHSKTCLKEKQQGHRSQNINNINFVFVLGAGILGQWSPSGHADFYVCSFLKNINYFFTKIE